MSDLTPAEREANHRLAKANARLNELAGDYAAAHNPSHPGSLTARLREVEGERDERLQERNGWHESHKALLVKYGRVQQRAEQYAEALRRIADPHWHPNDEVVKEIARSALTAPDEADD